MSPGPGHDARNRPNVEPMHANEALPLAIGTVAWTIALVVLLVLGADTPLGGRGWVWTCATGVAGGLFGLWFVWRRKRAGYW